MAANPHLAARIREALSGVSNLEEKKMFQGIAFMIDEKLCLSAGSDELLVRIDPDLTETVLEKTGCRQMVHNGRIMKGYFFVAETALHNQKELSYWIQLALAYNKVVKATRKKKAARK